MEQYAQNLMCTDEEKVITYCKNIIKAVEKTHDVAAQSKLKSVSYTHLTLPTTERV